MRLFDKLLKRNKQEEQHIEEQQVNENLPPKYKRETVKERYPDGLPLEVLQNIDYSKYGAVLKQQQLLPPSYDRNPASVEIRIVGSIPKVWLKFKSKTSNSFRTVTIYRYDVSIAKQGSKIYKDADLMQIEWENFCERIMWLYEKGFKLWHVNQIKLKDEELDL